MKYLGMCLVLAGLAGTALAGGGVRAPEMDGTSAAGALALLSGAILILRTRRKQ